MYSYLPCSGAFTSPFGYSFLGLNNGYLWSGPNYYAPPIGMFGYVPGVGLGRGYVEEAAAVLCAGRGGKTPTPPVTAGAKPPAPIKVPVFAGPAAHGAAPSITYTPGQAAAHAGGRSIPAMRGGAAGNSRQAIGAMAGPSMGRAARSGVSRAGAANLLGCGPLSWRRAHVVTPLGWILHRRSRWA